MPDKREKERERRLKLIGERKRCQVIINERDERKHTFYNTILVNDQLINDVKIYNCVRKCARFLISNRQTIYRPY